MKQVPLNLVALISFIYLIAVCLGNPAQTASKASGQQEPAAAPFELQFSGSSLHCAALSADGRQLAVSGGVEPGETAFFQVWDVKSGRELYSVRLNEDQGGHNVVRSIAFVPNAPALVARDHVGYSCWNIDAGERKYLIETADIERGLAVSPDGKFLALAVSEYRDGAFWKVRLVTAASGAKTMLLSGANGGTAESLEFSRDGKLLAAAVGTNVVLWDLTSKGESYAAKEIGFTVDSVALSPNGNTLAAFGGGAVFFFRISRAADGTLTLEQQQSLRNRSTVAHPLLFSADGKMLFGLSSVWLQQQGTWSNGRRLPAPIIAMSADGVWIAAVDLNARQVTVLPADELPATASFSVRAAND